MSDADDFAVTCECMSSVGIDESLQRQVFCLLAGILHMGNIEFEADDSEGQVGDVIDSAQGSFDSSARLLGVEPEELLAALRKQNMYVGSTTIVKTQSRGQVGCRRRWYCSCCFLHTSTSFDNLKLISSFSHAIKLFVN